MKKLKYVLLMLSLICLLGVGYVIIAVDKYTIPLITDSRYSERNIYLTLDQSSVQIQLGTLGNEDELSNDYCQASSTNSIFMTARLNNDEVYWVRVRTGDFNETGEVKGKHSEWSEKVWFVPQPLFMTDEYQFENNMIKIAWEENLHADKYTIYMRKDDSEEWIEMASTEKTNYTFTEYEGETIDLSKSSYSFVVVPSVKIGEEIYYSNKDYYMTVYTDEAGDIQYNIELQCPYYELVNQDSVETIFFGPQPY